MTSTDETTNSSHLEEQTTIESASTPDETLRAGKEEQAASPVETRVPINHLFIDVNSDLTAKAAALCDLLEARPVRPVVVFCNTRADALLAETRLRKRGINARRLTTNLLPAQASEVMQRVRGGSVPVIVATDMGAQGLELGEFSLVINYSVHDQPDVYAQRTGLKSASSKIEAAITLVAPADFSSFHNLKKSSSATFSKTVVPSTEEVMAGRIKGLSQLLSQQGEEISDRDLVLARSFLAEARSKGAEGLERDLAVIFRALVENKLEGTTKSLDEEFESAETPMEGSDRRSDRRDSYQREDNRDNRYSRGPRGRDGNRGGRDGRDDRRGRDDDRRGRDNRGSHDRRDYREPNGNRDYGRDNRDRRDYGRDRYAGQRSEHRQHQSEDTQHEEAGNEQIERGNLKPEFQAPDYSSQPKEERPDSLRVYIGQGLTHGMTPQLFSDLAVEFADIAPQDIKYLVVRDHYGFAELEPEKANSLISNLNGIEYNGYSLPVEVAAAIRHPAPRNDRRNDYRQDRSRNYRRDRGRRDDRRRSY